MTLRALPIQFLNLGGEMMYIIDQRLGAQCISDDKANKVRNDIICTMLNKKFIEEMFKPQPLYSSSSLKTIFSKLAHASIMRLNAVSMDKLYDLMQMSLKHQVLMSLYPEDLLYITLNHLDVMSTYATSPLARASVKNTVDFTIKTYSCDNMVSGELADIRWALLNFVQDAHVRVSLFLKEGIQEPDGNFKLFTEGELPPGTETPGIIRYYNSNGDLKKSSNFPPGATYTSAKQVGSLGTYGSRETRLGLNMYNENPPEESSPRSNEVLELSTTKSSSCIDDADLPQSGRHELNLLLQLIGTTAPDKKEFRLNIFQDDFIEYNDDSPVAHSSDADFTMNKDLQETHKMELGRILGDFSGQDKEDEQREDDDDLLTLLDSA